MTYVRYPALAVQKRLSSLRYVGMTPFQYLLHYRLEKGAKQLKLTHNNVTEVAMDCGFSTTSYFIQMFKDKYKVTPKQFQLSH